MCGEDLRNRIGQRQIASPTPAVPSEPRPPPSDPSPAQYPPTPQYQGDLTYPTTSTVEYGTFISRFFAWLIDIIIVAILCSFFVVPLIFSVGYQRAMFVNNVLNVVFGFLYFWLLESYNQGRTLGKVLLKLRAVDEETLQIATPGRYFMNNVTKTITVWVIPLIIIDVLLGLLINSGDPKRKIRLTQNISRIVVIKE